MNRRVLVLAVVAWMVPAVAAPPQVRFVECGAAGFDPSLARAVFESEVKTAGPPLEVQCKGAAATRLVRGASAREVKLEGLSPVVRATTLGMALVEMSREATPSVVERPAPAPVVAESAEPVARPAGTGRTVATTAEGRERAARASVGQPSVAGARSPSGSSGDSRGSDGAAPIAAAAAPDTPSIPSSTSAPLAAAEASRGSGPASTPAGARQSPSPVSAAGAAIDPSRGPREDSASVAVTQEPSPGSASASVAPSPSASGPETPSTPSAAPAPGASLEASRGSRSASASPDFAETPALPSSASASSGATQASGGSSRASTSAPETSPSAERPAEAPASTDSTSVAANAKATVAGLTASLDGPHGAGATLVPFDLALLPPISIDGAIGGRTRNFGSLALFASSTTHLDGVAISAGASFVQESTHGLQLAALFAQTNDLIGLQASGAGAWNGGSTLGLQLGAGLAWTGQDVAGVQAAGGLAVTRGSVLGLQLAPVSIAGPLRGAQLGVLNIGDDVDGTQIGVVNIARRVRGAQLGVVNLAQSAAVPLGLVNVIEDGRFRVAAWASDTTTANVTLKLGGEHVYSHLDVGWNPRGSGRAVSHGPATPVGTGLGWQLNPGQGLFGEVELSYLYLWDYRGPWYQDFAAGVRTQWGWRFADRLAVYAGVQFQVFGQDNPTAAAPTPFGWTVHEGSDVRITLAPGVLAGVEI